MEMVRNKERKHFCLCPFHSNQNNQVKIKQMPAKCPIFHSTATYSTVKVGHLDDFYEM